MHLTGPLAVLAGLALATARSSPYRPHWSLPSRQTTFDASTATLDEFMAYALETANARITSAGGTCTTENTIVRKEFTNLSGDERIAYTDALLCLIALPPKTPSDLAGAQSRFDDFVVTHINQTTTIHNTVSYPPRLESQYCLVLLVGLKAKAHTYLAGQLPRLAPFLPPRDGAGPEERVWLHRWNPILGLDQDGRDRPRCLRDGRRLRDESVGQRRSGRAQRHRHRRRLCIRRRDPDL